MEDGKPFTDSMHYVRKAAVIQLESLSEIIKELAQRG